MSAVKHTAEQRASRRLLRELRVRRLNVAVAGLVVYTSNVSRHGAQLVCPAMRFPALGKQLESQPFEIELELPTGRDVVALATLRYACPCEDEYLIGIEFKSFRGGDAAGWFAYIDWVCDPAPAAV